MIKTKYLTLIAFLAVTNLSCASINDTPKALLVGDVSVPSLLKRHKNFALPFERFSVTDQEKATVTSWPKDLKIKVYFGTWCHDSEREVPRLLKIASLNNHIELSLVALDYKKSEPQGRANADGVRYTPTFVVSLHGEELGRIVERPKRSLVDDIESMLANHSG